jgi:MFS family permease
LGFVCSTGIFLLIGAYLTNADVLRWGWRIPFLASAALVLVGLYIRLQLVETPAFRRSLERGERVRVPFITVVTGYPRELILGILGTATTFLIFYLMTVFALSWATTALKFSRPEYLVLQMVGVLFFGLTIPISALLADRIGGLRMIMIATVSIMVFGFCFEPLFAEHDTVKVFCFLALGFSLTGLTYGPLGSALASLFPTSVRYTGTSLAFNGAGILGASLAPLIATHLSLAYGLRYVGYYLSAAGLVTLLALAGIRARPSAG